MKQYFECHITMTGDIKRIKIATKAAGWTFSSIDGDPDLGAGIKCYATKQFNTRLTQKDVISSLREAARVINLMSDAKILRRKVELVIFDERE